MKSAILRLTQLGFSEYEARTYVALLKENPLTAYEIAKFSEIPTSKIYEVIRKLEGRRIIQSIHGARSKLYVPLSPDEFIHNFRAHMDSNLQAMKEDLKDTKAGMDTSYTWHIRDYEGLLHKALRMVDTARGSLLLSAWPPEMEQLLGALQSADARGVKIAAIHYGATGIKLKQLYIHPVEDTIYSERGLRGFILVADSREALNGTIGGTKVEAIWSMNESFAILAEGYIRHDIYQMKTMKRFSPLLRQTFGAQYEKMRDIFSDDDL